LVFVYLRVPFFHSYPSRFFSYLQLRSRFVVRNISLFPCRYLTPSLSRIYLSSNGFLMGSAPLFFESPLMGFSIIRTESPFCLLLSIGRGDVEVYFFFWRSALSRCSLFFRSPFSFCYVAAFLPVCWWVERKAHIFFPGRRFPCVLSFFRLSVVYIFSLWFV